MKCECCLNSEAVVHVKHASNGEVKEIHLCGECAAKKGFNAPLTGMSLTDLLFGIEIEKEAETPAPDPACPGCHMRRSDFRKASRFGCAVCYDTFAEEVQSCIAEYQKGSRHTGKAPARQAARLGIGLLRKRLEAAVAAQDFEEAARLRDRIRELSAGVVTDESGRT